MPTPTTDLWHRIVKAALSYNRWTVLFLALLAGLVVYASGCRPTVTSPLTNQPVNRAELERDIAIGGEQLRIRGVALTNDYTTYKSDVDRWATATERASIEIEEKETGLAELLSGLVDPITAVAAGTANPASLIPYGISVLLALVLGRRDKSRSDSAAADLRADNDRLRLLVERAAGGVT